MCRTTHFALIALSLSGGLLSTTPGRARAQESQSFQIQLGGAQLKTEGGEGIVIRLGEASGYWLGVELEPLDAEHRAQTDLPEGQGLEVQQVVPDSPAAKAGVQEDDILVSVGDKPLGTLADLQKFVQESDGKPLSIALLRQGEKKTVEITPARRPEGGAIVVTEAGEEGAEGQPQVRGLNQLLRQLRPQAQPGGAGGAVQWQPLRVVAAGPGPQNAAFPDDLSVTIRKNGNKPLRIKVTQGVLSWTIGADELDKLPEAIRGHVAGLLPRPGPVGVAFAMPAQARMMIGQQPQPGPVLPPGASLPPGAPLPGSSPAPNPLAEMQMQLQQLKLQLHALQVQVEALRKPE